MTLFNLERNLDTVKENNDLGNPIIKICVSGRIIDVVDIVYNEKEDCIIITDGSL